LHELFEQNTPHLNPESCNEKILFLMLSFSTLNETLKYLEIGLALKSLFDFYATLKYASFTDSLLTLQ
jgi:hypothetical protein